MPGNFFDQFDDKGVVEASNMEGFEPTLRERFVANFLDATRYTPEGALGRHLETRSVPEGTERRQIENKQRSEVRDFEQMAQSDTAVEWAVAMGGQLAGGASAPSSYVYAPLRLVGASIKAARPIAGEVIERALNTGIANVGIDTSTQGLKLAFDQQEEFSPAQTAASFAIGAVLGAGTGVPAARSRARGAIERGEGLGFEPSPRFFDQFDDDIPATADEIAEVVAKTPEVESSTPKVSEGKPDDAVPESIAAREVIRAEGDEAARAEIRRGGPGEIARPEAGATEGPKPKRLEDVINRLTEAAPDPTAFRQGRIRSRKAIGTFNRQSGVVRIKDVTDFQTITHEIAHAYESRFKAPLQRIKNANSAELKPLAYAGAPKNKLVSEGFAEFTRHYVANPVYARNQAPKFFDAFESFMEKSAPDQLAVLRESQTAYREWLDAPSGAVVKTDVVSDKVSKFLGSKALGSMSDEVKRHGFRNALSGWQRGLYTATLDRLHPIDTGVQELLRVYEINHNTKLDLKAADDAYKLQRLAVDASQGGMVDMMHGVVPHRGVHPEGPSFQGAMEKTLGKRMVGKWDEEAIEELGAYLMSRRMLAEFERFKAGEIPNAPGKFTEGDYRVAIDEFETANPEWREAVKDFYAFQDNLLIKKHAAGFLTDDQLTAFLAKKDYVPLMRDMKDFGAEVGVFPKSKGVTGKSAIVQAFRGSNRSVINPLESIMRDTIETANLIARNNVFKALDDLAVSAGPGGGSIVERIPNSQLKATRVTTTEAINAAAKDAGIDPRDVQILRDLSDATLGEGSSGNIFRAGDAPEGGEPIIYVWRNGERQALRLADDKFGRQLYSAMTGLGQEMSGPLLNIASLGATVLRTGVTTSPDFLLANFVRDQATAWILSGDGFVPFFSGVRGVADEIAGGENARLYAQFGGLAGGENVAALHSARIDRDLQSLRRKGYAIERTTSLKGFFKLVETAETGTRVGLFGAAYKRAKKQGLSEYEAAIEAAYTARDYFDFGRHGSRMLEARRLVPFFNASLQGIEKGYRALVTPFVKYKSGQALTSTERRNLGIAAKGWAKVSAIGMLGLGLTAIYKDDPEYEEISDYFRATHWMIKDQNGKWIAVPKPFEFAVLSNIFERSFEAANKNDPTAWGRMREGLAEIMLPPITAPGITVPVELLTNHSFFRDRPILGQALEGLEPDLQWNAWSSEFGKNVGKAIGVPAPYIDHAIQGFGGSWGRQILNWSNLARENAAEQGLEDQFITRRFIKDVSRGSNSTRQFWELIARDSGAWSKLANSYKQDIEVRDQDTASRRLEGRPAESASYALLNAHYPAKMKRIHPVRRARDAIRAASSFRKEMSTDRLKGIETDKKIIFTPSQKGALDNVLSRLSMIEARNSLITAGVPGWKQKQYMETKPVWDELRAASPVAYEEVRTRYAKNKVYSEKGVRKAWPEAQKRIMQDRDKALLSDLLGDARHGG